MWKSSSQLHHITGDGQKSNRTDLAKRRKKREHILAGVRKTAAVCLADLADIRHMVGAGTQFGGQGDLIPDVQRVDLPEVAVGTAVVGGEADIALPDGGVLEMPDTLGKRLAVRSLINTDTQIQRGDIQPAKRTVFVVELARYIREQHGGLIAAAAIHRAAGCDNSGGAAANDRAGRGNTTGSEIGGKVFAGMERIHALRAKNGRNESGIFAHILVAHGAAICRVDHFNRGVLTEVVIIRRIDTVFQRIRRSRQSRCHAKAQAKGNVFFHSAVSSSSAFSFLCFTSSAPPTPAPAAATIPRGIST